MHKGSSEAQPQTILPAEAIGILGLTNRVAAKRIAVVSAARTVGREVSPGWATALCGVGKIAGMQQLLPRGRTTDFGLKTAGGGEPDDSGTPGRPGAWALFPPDLALSAQDDAEHLDAKPKHAGHACRA